MFVFVVYSFLFLALFFEVFLVITFFDTDARRRRTLPFGSTFPSVSIIVPCHNEEKTIGGTSDSLLALEYPKEKLTIVLVDDGSTDTTALVMERYRHMPNVRIIMKENGGKHTALNAGIAATDSEFVGCLDADSFVAPEALKHVMANFDHREIGAVTASMSIYAPKKIIERMQQAEYLFGIALRHILATLNGLYVTPGPFTVYRRKMFETIGLFRTAHNTEDMEIAMRMQKMGWKIQNAPQARVYTKAPETLRGLVKQRTRWTTGFIRNGFDYRILFGNPRYGALGLIVLPLAVVAIYLKVLLFPITWFHIGKSLWRIAERVSAVPLSFSFRLHPVDWFFAPVNTLSLLSLLTLAITIVLMLVGARISRTRTQLGPSIFWYLALYGTIAPVWIVRSLADVALGIRREWR